MTPWEGPVQQPFISLVNQLGTRGRKLLKGNTEIHWESNDENSCPALSCSKASMFLVTRLSEGEVGWQWHPIRYQISPLSAPTIQSPHKFVRKFLYSHVSALCFCSKIKAIQPQRKSEYEAGRVPWERGEERRKLTSSGHSSKPRAQAQGQSLSH